MDRVELCGELLHVRLLNPTSHDADAVSARLGLAPMSCREDPDLVLRFLERITVEEPVVAVGDALIADSGEILVSDGDRRSAVKLALCPEDLPPGLEVRCRQGCAAALPLHELAALCALRRNALPIHAAAVAIDGRGIAVTGRSGAGKTGVVLAHMAQGASLVASEHVVVDSEGRMHGRQEAIRLRPHHLTALSAAPAARIPRHDLRCLSRWALATSVAKPLLRPGSPLPAQLRHKASRILRDQACRDVDASLFPSVRSAAMSALLLLIPTTQRAPTVQEMTPAEAAQRLAHLFREDTNMLRRLRQSRGFVFPEKRWPLLDGAYAAYTATAERVLTGRRLLMIRRPEVADPVRLTRALDPWLGP